MTKSEASDLITQVALWLTAAAWAVLLLIFLAWIALELINWHKQIKKGFERKFIYGAFLFIIISPFTIAAYMGQSPKATLSMYFLLFSGWLTIKAYQRVIKREPRKSDISKIQKYIQEREDFEALIGRYKQQK